MSIHIALIYPDGTLKAIITEGGGDSKDSVHDSYFKLWCWPVMAKGGQSKFD